MHEEMEEEQKTGNAISLSIEQIESYGAQNPDSDVNLQSAHTVGQDSWQQVGLMLVTSFNCGYILSFSNLILVNLGWTWGIVCLLVVGFFTAYANWLLSTFHFINGKRFIRYRDLMAFVYGREMHHITWTFQFLTLLLLNMGFIILGGRALKEISTELSDSPLRLQYLIILTGVAYFLFAFLIPTMSAMRAWLGVSAILTSAYIVVLLVFLVKDGKSNTTSSYEISGNKMDKMFNAFGALSAIIVCNTSGLLPEIQSTLRRPAVENMKKALSLQYTAGLTVYYGVSVLGYWAYGASVSSYLPQDLNAPKPLKIMINTAVFLQSIISQHMFVAPIHEAMDTKFLKLDEALHSRENIKRLLLLRACFFTGNTFITAAFPFMGDFVNLVGSFTLIPLTFVFPSLIFIKVKGKTAKMKNKLWHWFLIIFFSLLAVATTIAAVRLIVKDMRIYSFFADI